MPDPIPSLLPTTAIGSHSLPRWLGDLVKAGCRFIQVDEPVRVGYPDEVKDWAVEAFASGDRASVSEPRARRGEP